MTQASGKNENDEMRDTLMMFGGLALVMLGTGMILTAPFVRRLMGGVNVAGLLQAAGPDFERYMKLKSM